VGSSIASLIVKIGAQTEEIDKALANIGVKAKKTDADLKALGDTPLAVAAQKSLADLTQSMNGITKAQQDVAEKARLAATGLDQIGGASRLTGMSSSKSIARSRTASMRSVRSVNRRRRISSTSPTR
jgi:citrate lyase beta subunit